MSSDMIAGFIEGLQYDQLPPAVVAKAKGAIRDTLGVAIAANRDAATEAARQMAGNRGGAPDSTLLGFGLKVPCELSAFVNAVMASTLDMDDGSMGLPGHLRLHRGPSDNWGPLDCPDDRPQRHADPLALSGSIPDVDDQANPGRRQE